MSPSYESPLCSKCRQLARGRLTEIKRLDGQPWAENVHRWWLINVPGMLPGQSSSIQGREFLSNINNIMQGVGSGMVEIPKPSCAVEGPIDPFFHHDATTLDSVSGCRLCTGRVPKCVVSPEDRATEYTQCIVLVKEKRPLPGAVVVKIVFVYVGRGFSYVDRASICVDIFDGEELSLPKTMPQRSLKPTTVRQIMAWLEDCENGQGHEVCRESLLQAPGEALQSPSRLIRIERVDDSIYFYLKERNQFLSDCERVRYATLSYHWGPKGTSWMLTRENYNGSCRGLPTEVLPIVFQDSIRVALSIGISYIWVDALCIIQDSDADWEYEAPRMATVYSHGTLNIAATHSPDVHTGIFVQNSFLSRGSISIYWTNTDIPQGQWAIDGLRNWDKHSTSPLNKRGWVFQETLLSPRVLHFAADQIWMQCREHVQSETKSLSMHRAYESIRLKKTPFTKDSYSRLCDGDWVSLVIDFAYRNLTVDTDRLVAFAGVAEMFSRMHGLSPLSYFAGIWYSGAVDQLLWRTDIRQPARKRLKEYGAPTYSWASINANVHYLWSMMPDRSTLSNPNFDIIEISTTLASSSPSASPFGPVTDGYLDIRAPLHPITIDYRERDRSRSLVLKIAGGNDFQTCYPDDDTTAKPRYEEAFTMYYDEDAIAQLPKPFRAILVPMRRSRNAPLSRWYRDVIENLVLWKTEHKGVYERVGVCRIGSKDLYSELPRWWSQGSSIGNEMFLDNFDDGTYKIRII